MKVIGGYDPVVDQFLVAFRDGHGDYPSHGGKVDPSGVIVYSPVDFKDMGNMDAKITLRLASEEAKALGELLAKHGFMPKTPDDLSPTKAHLADALSVRDRLLTIVERK